MKKLLLSVIISLFLVVSVNAFAIQWTKAIGSGWPHYSTSMALDTSGQPFVTGFASNGADYAMYTEGLNEFGDSIWANSYVWSNGADEHAIDITIDNQNRVILTGDVHESAGAVFAVVKYANSGDVDWVDTLGAPTSQGLGVTTDDSGNIYVTGYITSDTTRYCLTAKLDSAGGVVWADTFDSVYSQGSAIALDDSGNLYVGGYAYRDTIKNYLLMKYNASTGAIGFRNIKDYTVDNYSGGLAINAFGQIYMIVNYSDNRYYVLKFDKIGNNVAGKSFQNETGGGITIDSTGHLFLTGLYYGTKKDIFVIETDTVLTNSPIWGDTLAFNNEDAWGQGIGISDDGNIYVLARRYMPNAHYYVMKYVTPYEDIGVSSITSPDTGIVTGGYYPISAVVGNYGNIYESFNVYAAVYDSVSDSLLFAETLSVDSLKFGNATSVNSDSFFYEPFHQYKTVVYVNLPDTNASNDTQIVYTHAVASVDVGVDTILSPKSGVVCGGYKTISAKVENFSNISQSFNVYAAVYDSTSNSLLALDSTQVSLNASIDTTVNIDSFDYELNHQYKTVVYVNLPDTNVFNDTQYVYTSPKHFKVLFVEDAEGRGAPYHPDSTWYIPLCNLVGNDSLYWYGPTTNTNENGPSLAEMKMADLVIWNTYDNYDAPCFTDNDTTNINDYINQGGKIWLIGQDIFYSMLGSKSVKRNRLERAIFPWLDQFGVDSVIEDYLGDTTMTIQGTGQVTGNPISVHSDFDTSYDGGLYPDIIIPDTSAQAVLIDPNSSYTIGIITNDSTKAFWAADGRGADLTPGGDWETLIGNMLKLFGISQQGIRTNNKIVEISNRAYMIKGKTVGSIIDFMYKGPSSVDIAVNDISGREIRLFKSVKSGSKMALNAKPGIYFVRIIGKNVTTKISVIK